jgi:hypothetical protein
MKPQRAHVLHKLERRKRRDHLFGWILIVDLLAKQGAA